VVVAGAKDDDNTRALLDAVRSKYMPNAVLVRVDPTGQDATAEILPWVSAMRTRDGRAAAYVCREFACQAPTTDAATLAAQL